MRTVVAALVLLALPLVAAAEPALKPDVVGKWLLITQARGDDVESILVVSRGAQDALAATYTASNGAVFPVKEIKFDTGTLSFTRSVGPREIRFEAAVTGDRLAGAQRMGRRTFPVYGARGDAAKAALRAARKKANATDADIETDYDKRSRRAVARDAFPVLFDPKMTPATDAQGIEDDEFVIGISKGTESKAYPVLIMGKHELVNDTIDKDPVTASW